MFSDSIAFRPAFKLYIKQIALKFLRTPLDLGWLFGWRDLILILGPAAITYGVHLIYRPAAWIVGGGFALGLYYMMITGAERVARAARVEAEKAKQVAEQRRVQRGTIS